MGMTRKTADRNVRPTLLAKTADRNVRPTLPAKTADSNACIILLALAFLGQTFQWELAQAGAWVRMIRDFRQTDSIAVAVEKTFSGRAPCSACTRLAKEKTSPSSDDPALGQSIREVQPLATSSGSGTLPPPMTGTQSLPASKKILWDLSRPAPPVPPPRQV
jgi:hypothetical protein